MCLAEAVRKKTQPQEIKQKKGSNKEKKKKNIYLSAGIHCTRGRHYTTTPRNPTLMKNLQIFYLKHLPLKILVKNTF